MLINMLMKITPVFFLLSAFVFSQSDTSLILSEIMFYPVSGPNEFVELYNRSEINSININGYKIKYYTSSPDVIISAGEGTILPPKSFAIVLEGDYPFGSGIYDGLIPPEALVVKISDNAFGTSGMANTENRPLWLLRPANDTLEAYIYSANNPQSRSDEKKIMIKDSSRINWANSLVTNGTPGFTNSVTPVEFDLQMASLTFQPSMPFEGDDVTILAKVKNLGTNNANIFSIEIFNDVNFDSTADPGEIIFSQQYTNLASGDSITVSTVLSSLPSGNYQIIARVIFQPDERPGNNQLIKSFIVFPPGHSYNDIVINEIMYAPSTGEPEWVELYNRTASAVNLKNWKFADLVTTVTITNSDKYIPGNGFIVLTRDSSILNFYNVQSEIIQFNLPALNNAGDAVVIKDHLAATIDSLYYLPSWGGNTGGRSLERISTEESSTEPSNWGTSKSIFKATPGYINSITKKDFDVAVENIFFDPSFPIQGDTVSIAARIKNTGKNNAVFSLQLFEDTNLDSVPDVLISSLENLFLLSDDSANFDFNFLIEGLQSKRGFFVKAVYELDQDTLNNKFYRTIEPGTPPKSIVINEIMYAPSTGEPEWVELYNRTASAVNLKNWKFADLVTTVTITNSDKYIPGNGFIVLTRDSSILNFYNVQSEIIQFNLPALNNAGDAVVIKDHLAATIDSLYYLPSWGGNTGGRSLERISTEESSTEPSNWGTSKSIFKATPGYINSITKKDFDVAVENIFFDPSFPIQGDTVSIAARIKNTGKNNAVFSLQLFEDTNLDSVPDVLISSLENLFLLSDDSANFDFNFLIEGLQSKRGFFVKAVYELDQDTLNNKFYRTIEPGTPPKSIVINEIMYAPSTGEPEWVELYNRTASAVNLKNWKFADLVTTVTITNSDKYIPGNGFIVLTRDSSILNFYNVQSEIIQFNLPALNNAGDAVVIKDHLAATIDSLYYLPSWGGNTGGRSLERISTEESSTEPSNWGTSKSIFKATPGYINSITKKDFDVAVENIFFDPSFPIQGDTVSIAARIKNTGKNNAVFSLQLFEDTNLDSVPDVLISSLENLFLLSDDSANFDFNFLIEGLQSKRGFFVSAVFELDQDTTNNKLYKTIESGFPAQSVVINEIMYAPSGGEPEWVELFNRTNLTINLKGWRVSDVFTTPATVTISQDVYIEANSYIVLSRNAEIFNFHRFIPSPVFVLSLPVLNNDVDGVVLKDNRRLQMDSVLYLNQWGGRNGYSLERLSVDAGSNLPVNWGTSLDIEQSTPGRINSLTPKQFDLLVTGMNFNPRFPVEGDKVYISAAVRNNGSSFAGSFVVEFYIDTDSNNVVDKLLSAETGLSLASGEFLNITSSFPIQNLTSKILTAVRVVFAADEDTLNNYFEKFIEPGFPAGIVMINEVMYNTETGKPEWVELVNVSADSINIKNWSVSDVLTTPTKSFITNNDVMLHPDEYIVIAKDTSFNSAHPGVTAIVFYSNFGILGNTSDGVVIYDFRNGIIDSLFYFSSWGGGRGLSLERISLADSTNKRTNWTTSLSPKGSTPGAPNSILNVTDYRRNDLVINEIMFDPGTDNSEFVEFLNISGDSLNLGGWEIIDENGNSHRLSQISLMLPNNSFFLLAADSSVIYKYGLDESVYKNILSVSSLGLVNTGESILLRDVKGNVIDSVFYSNKWHNRNFGSTKNISLEKINPNLGSNDPNNWSSSVDPIGATPGKQNSIYTVNLNTESNISVSPNPFSPDNDGFEDFTIINYKLTQATSQVRIKIFDNKGRLMRTLANNQASGSSGSVIFDGIGDDGQTLRIGIYIIFLEAINEGAGVVETMKTVVVVARKL